MRECEDGNDLRSEIPDGGSGPARGIRQDVQASDPGNKASRLPERADPVQRERPRQHAGVARVGIEGASSSLAWHAASHALSRRRRRVANETKYGRLLPRRDDLKIAKVR